MEVEGFTSALTVLSLEKLAKNESPCLSEYHKPHSQVEGIWVGLGCVEGNLEFGWIGFPRRQTKVTQ